MKRAVPAMFTVGAIALAACAESQSLAFRGGVAVSFATHAPVAVPAPPASRTAGLLLDDTIVTGSDTLVLTRVQLVLRQIELKRSDVAGCTSPDDDGCEEIELGPSLVDLPLTPGPEQAFAVELPVGTYDRIDFEVHKVGSDSADLAFLQQHPGFEDISIRVEGTFNGTPFVFLSDANEEQEFILAPALVVSETASRNVTIFVDVDGWFRRGDGTVLDPATANTGGPNESLVRNNIRDSFDAFEDDDRDGDHS
jgi:hypothetical protein